MPRLTLIASLLAFCVFNFAQYRGWNAFAEQAQTQQLSAERTQGFRHGHRSYHK